MSIMDGTDEGKVQHEDRMSCSGLTVMKDVVGTSVYNSSVSGVSQV